MVKVFTTSFKVTQKFAARPAYYKQFGLAGHEGIDLVPLGSDWTIYSLPYKGTVVKDIDMADKGKAYGITCTIWYPEINEAWQYCHMSANKVFEGQEIGASTPIGTMGATGNVDGAHLHANRFSVDPRGYRLNKDNGYLGGIDPLPFLEQNLGQETPDAPIDEHKEKGISLLDSYRATRLQGPEGNWEGFANAIIASDREASNTVSKITSLQDEIKNLKIDNETALKVQKETLENAKTTEINTINADWQKKVESATLKEIKDASVGELIAALLNKFNLGKGGEVK